MEWINLMILIMSAQLLFKVMIISLKWSRKDKILLFSVGHHSKYFSTGTMILFLKWSVLMMMLIRQFKIHFAIAVKKNTSHIKILNTGK